MQIITIEDKDFSRLLEAFKYGKEVGRYWRSGTLQVVCATSHFMLVRSNGNPDKIALKPARSLSEAEDLALRLLTREEQRGNAVERDESYSK